MNLSFLTLAADTASGTSSGTAGTNGTSILVMVGWIAVMLVAMYFLMIRPQRKKQKEEKQMRENLQVGDEVVTIGGIYGRVISLKEDSMVIESKSDHSKLTVARWALQQNLTIHDDTPKKK